VEVEAQVFGQDDIGRERQRRKDYSCRNQADTIRKAKPPGQHRDNRGEQ
jgi:hypothetical protein